MARGGAREGAGRKPGGTNRANQEAVEQAKAGGEMPLDFLLRIMRDPESDEAKQIDCAKAAAPYCHQKLSAIDLTGDMTVRHEDTLDELE
jgi:hypothetical protein